MPMKMGIQEVVDNTGFPLSGLVEIAEMNICGLFITNKR
jgi:hypothetical protein